MSSHFALSPLYPRFRLSAEIMKPEFDSQRDQCFFCAEGDRLPSGKALGAGCCRQRLIFLILVRSPPFLVDSLASRTDLPLVCSIFSCDFTNPPVRWEAAMAALR